MREERRASRARGSKGAQTWLENARSWARPRRGDRGREVEDELTGGDVGTQRERERARVRETALTGLTHGAARERGEERARSGWRRQAGPACQAQGARGWDKWASLG
jgi:hypothetical protein